MLTNSEFTIHPSIRLCKAEERFLLFVRQVNAPLTEQKILDWYLRYVAGTRMRTGIYDGSQMQNGVMVSCYREPTMKEELQRALNWFDRSLGRAIRKNLLPRIETKVLRESSDDLLSTQEPHQLQEK